VGAGVETSGEAGLSIRLLGPLSVHRDGAPVVLPRSRKVRALLAFLALTPGAVGRSKLCDLLWEVPIDPRGELRWCLSRLRSVLGPDERRLTTPATDQVALDVSGCFVDAVAVDRAIQPGVGRMETEELAKVCGWFGGELLGGLHLDGSAGFYGWLTAQRQRYHTLQIAVLEELVARSPPGSEETFLRLEAWLQLAPFELRPHEVMLEALTQRGRLRDAQDHLTKTIRLFEEQGVDTFSLREKWRMARDGVRRTSSVPAAGPAPSSPKAPSSVDAETVAPGVELVGREREWAHVSMMWSAACEGRASFLLITGEAGIGKTRLAEDFLTSAGSRGASAVRAACYLADRPMAYAAVADWLRCPPFQPVLDGLPAPQLSQLARVMPGILIDRPDVPPPAPFTESWQRAHFFEALARALLAAPQPLLAFIDDVQWCDPETIEWLHYLLRSDPKARVMVLATARTGDVGTDHPVAGMLRDLRRSERGAEIALGPLSADDTASLAAKIAARLPDSAGRSLYEKTRGNPLFIVEMVRAGLGGGDDEALPAKVHAVIRTRFSQLSNGARDVASLAAVVGRPFSSNLLARVSGGDEDAIAGAIDELWQRRLIQTHAAGAYDFTHGLLRDVCYSDLGPERRRSLHRRIAMALGALHAAESDAASAYVAEHFERGGQPWEAVPHLERAAAVARHRYAEGESIAFLQRALGLLEQAAPGNDRDRTELRLLASLGQALMRTRGYGAPEVGRALTRARELCDTVDDAPRRFAVLSGSFLHHVVRADLELAHAIASTCMDWGMRTGDPAIVCGGRFALGSSVFHLGDIAHADEQFAAVVASYDIEARPRASYEFGLELGVFCRAYMGHTRWLLGDAEGAHKCSRDAISRAETLSHPFSLAVALAYDAMLQQFRGEPELTRRQADAAEALCLKHGFLYYLSWMPILRGWARARSGSVSEGLAEMRDGYASFCATGAQLRAPYYLALMAEVSLESGDHEEALLLVEDGRATARRTGERWQDAELTRLHAAASTRKRRSPKGQT
jgi:DNA-binding SARP family transcriptional activator/predicted ATPase